MKPFDQIEMAMQEGYRLESDGQDADCARLWLDCWRDVLLVMDDAGYRSINEFDEAFRGTQCLFNWVQDFEAALLRAGREEREFLTATVDVCGEFLGRFPREDPTLVSNCRRDLAEAVFALGETARADAMYAEWMRENPRWGWGWIGWSDGHRFAHPDIVDLGRAEKILLDALAVTDVEDRPDIVDRLADLYDFQGRGTEAAKFRATVRPVATTREERVDSLLRRTTSFDFGEQGLPLDDLPKLAAAIKATTPQKVGRNDPCPCGSGKKFKKCCGG